MDEFSRDRVRSLAGAVSALVIVIILTDYGSIREGALAFEQALFASSTTSWMLPLVGLIAVGSYGFLGWSTWFSRLQNPGRLESFESWCSAFHAGSGILAAVFILWHLAMFSWPALEVSSGLASWTSIYLQSSSLVLFGYGAGVLALAVHISTGAFHFAIGWGLATGERAMGRAAIGASVLFGWFTLTGLETIAYFLQGVS